ncbi:BID domain-containing T4SS effector [Bartonella rattaustraliani]|uniref:BID domain-containing T4SS effector n=1 Tax=Bartonella rattaustraliani TaxID=481139 RepID=UPI0002F994A1|nr:BID domain-containing T4SS effector [Bartonella rattaustraliani]
MKRHQHPQPSQTPEEGLYAQVNKSRGRGQNSQQPREVLYADIQHPGEREQSPQQPREVLYADIQHPGERGQNPQQPGEVLYADINQGGRRQHHHRPGDTDYTEVNTRGKGHHHHRPGDTDYAEVNTRGRGHHHHRPGDTDYTEVNTRGRGPDLSEEDITKMAGNDPHVQAYRGEVQHWCKIVYGSSSLFDKHLDDILRNPRLGSEVSWDLAANPTGIHKLAGTGLGGLKSTARKRAENGFKPLCDALDGFTKAAENVRERLQRNPHAEVKRQEQLQSGERTQQIEQERQQQHAPEEQQRRRLAERRQALAM